MNFKGMLAKGGMAPPPEEGKNSAGRENFTHTARKPGSFSGEGARRWFPFYLGESALATSSRSRRFSVSSVGMPFSSHPRSE